MFKKAIHDVLMNQTVHSQPADWPKEQIDDFRVSETPTDQLHHYFFLLLADLGV